MKTTRIFAIVGLITAFALSAFAQAVVPPETVDGATSLIPKLIEAVVAGNYSIAGGIVLMVLMVAVRQYALPKWGLKSDVLPIVTALIAALASVGLSMTNGVPAAQAAVSGLTMALLAGGAWSLIGKYLAKLILKDKYQE